MKGLTKAAIVVTTLSLLALCATSATQAWVTDGKNIVCIVTWHAPFYGPIELGHSAWWIFVRIWMLALCAPPIAWIAVGIKHIASKSSRTAITFREST
jgi:hypothetical protein